MELAKELEASLREIATASSVEVRENGSRVAPLAGLSWEIRGGSAQPLLHLWSEQHNLTRRVLALMQKKTMIETRGETAHLTWELRRDIETVFQRNQLDLFGEPTA